MVDLRLRTYVTVITRSHLRVLKEARDEGGEEAWVDLSFPNVTLFLPGMIATGKVISLFTYLKRTREAIQDAPTSEENTSFKDILKAFFVDPPEDVAAKWLEDEDFEPRRIYLEDATIVVGDRTVTVGQVVFALEAVNGWTLGEFSA